MGFEGDPSVTAHCGRLVYVPESAAGRWASRAPVAVLGAVFACVLGCGTMLLCVIAVRWWWC